MQSPGTTLKRCDSGERPMRGAMWTQEARRKRCIERSAFLFHGAVCRFNEAGPS